MTMKNVPMFPGQAKPSAKPKKLIGKALLEASKCRAPMTAASEKRVLCHECGRWDGAPSLHQDTDGWNGQLVLLFGQRIDEDAYLFLVRLLREAGIDDSDWVCFDAVRCVGKKKPTIKQVRACRPFLVDFLATHRPKALLAFGAIALQAATNDGSLKTITAIRGKEYHVEGLDTVIYGTYHIQDVCAGSFALSTRIKEDLLRATGRLPRLAAPSRGIPRGPVCGIDTEFMQDGRVVTVSAADRLSGTAADVSNRTQSTRILERLRSVSALRGHNIAVDLDALVRLTRKDGIRLSKLDAWLQGQDIEDSLMLSRMADENRGKGAYALEVLLRSGFKAPAWKDTEEELDLTNPLSWPTDYRVERCRMDAWAPVVLCDTFRPSAHGPIEFSHRISQTLRRIYHAGATVDRPYFDTLVRQYQQSSSKAKQTLGVLAAKAGMTEFSPTNDGHLREILFSRYKLKAEEFTKTTKLPSVNKTFLKKHKEHEFVKALLEFNEQDKRHSTYGEGLAEKFTTLTGKPGIRFRINPLGARTGRRSSEQPNAQNWPKDVRKIIVSRFRDGAVVDNDYSKLEVILFAFMANEQKLMEFFQGPNGYIAVGKELFGKTVVDGTPEYTTIKSIVLGIQYGMGAFKLAYQLWNVVGVKLSADWQEHKRQAGALREKYLNKFPGIRKYMYVQKQRLLKDQYVESLTGRRRNLPCPFGEETPGFGHLLNQSINFPIQSFASDVTGSAMVDIESALLDQYGFSYEEYHWRLLQEKYPNMPLLINEVHDDLVFDMPAPKRRDNLALITQIMKEVPTLRALCPSFTIDLNIGQKVGSRWGLDDLRGK